jgi:hypothetical protein
MPFPGPRPGLWRGPECLAARSADSCPEQPGNRTASRSSAWPAQGGLSCEPQLRTRSARLARPSSGRALNSELAVGPSRCQLLDCSKGSDSRFVMLYNSAVSKGLA